MSPTAAVSGTATDVRMRDIVSRMTSRRGAALWWSLSLTLLAGCAGVVEENPDDDFSHPAIPDDAEIPEGADVPLLPPSEDEDDASISGPDDAAVEDVAPVSEDVAAALADAGRATVDVVTARDVVTTPDPSTPPPPCRRSVGPFTWACDGPVAGAQCVALTEPSDPDWTNNYLCTRGDLGLRWSRGGAIVGMRCTQIHEAAEPASHGWGDNYLCVPTSSSYQLSWSNAGPIPGRECVPFYEPADPHTWSDNYLCFTISAPPPPPPPPPPPRCTGSASGQSAIWTCTANRNARQRCVSGRVETVSCPHGCVPQPSGTHDYCAPAPPPTPSALPACARRPLLHWGLHPDASDRLRCAGVPASRITQTIGYATASAGTHGPDGRANGLAYSAATDISTRGLSTTEIRTLLSRLADQGFAAWYRWPGHDGWPSSEAPHIHAIYVGCRMKSSLQAQVSDWLVGRNGLTTHWVYGFFTWSSAQRALVRAVYNRFN